LSQSKIGSTKYKVGAIQIFCPIINENYLKHKQKKLNCGEGAGPVIKFAIKTGLFKMCSARQMQFAQTKKKQITK
jgi:hypothetical protein